MREWLPQPKIGSIVTTATLTEAFDAFVATRLDMSVAIVLKTSHGRAVSRVSRAKDNARAANSKGNARVDDNSGGVLATTPICKVMPSAVYNSENSNLRTRNQPSRTRKAHNLMEHRVLM